MLTSDPFCMQVWSVLYECEQTVIMILILFLVYCEILVLLHGLFTLLYVWMPNRSHIHYCHGHLNMLILQYRFHCWVKSVFFIDFDVNPSANFECHANIEIQIIKTRMPVYGLTYTSDYFQLTSINLAWLFFNFCSSSVFNWMFFFLCICVIRKLILNLTSDLITVLFHLLLPLLKALCILQFDV